MLCVSILRKAQFYVNHICNRALRYTARIVSENLKEKQTIFNAEFQLNLFIPSSTMLSKLCHRNYIIYSDVIIVIAIWYRTRQAEACFGFFLTLAH